MITFSNGHKLTFACASGALAFDGKGWWFEQPFRILGLLNPKAFTVVAKTVTYYPIKGNYNSWSPWTCIRLIRKSRKKGLVNAVGLTNDGFFKWIQRDYPEAKRMGYTISASVQPDKSHYAVIMGEHLSPLDLAYVEINLSCPNVSHDYDSVQIIKSLKLSCSHPIVAKLSFDQVNEKFIKDTEEFVEAYHAINTVPWDNIFPNEKSPIEKYSHKRKGGVSGDYIKSTAIKSVKNIKDWTDRPIIGGGGIFTLQDVYDFENAGAKAFSIGTCFTLSPWKPNMIVKNYINNLESDVALVYRRKS